MDNSGQNNQSVLQTPQAQSPVQPQPQSPLPARPIQQGHPAPSPYHQPIPSSQQSSQIDQAIAQAQMGQPQQPVSAGHPEQAPIVSQAEVAAENVPVVELSKSQELEPEVEGWLEKLERAEDVHLEQPVTHEDQTLVQASGGHVTEEHIVLPLTQEEVQEGLKHPLKDGVRWLAEWCVRVSKVFSRQNR